MYNKKGFTVIELLVVVAIIMLLAALLIPTLYLARAKGKMVFCENNLKQIHAGILIYQQDFIAQGGWDWFPARVTYLNRDGYTKGQKEVFICKMDTTKGADGGKPASAHDQFIELDEGSRAGEYPLSYMYEFSGAECSWGWEGWISWPPYLTSQPGWSALGHIDRNSDDKASWGEAKQAQLKYGDSWWNASRMSNPMGYSPANFPVLRCFWHTDTPDTALDDVLNMAYTGNIFKSGAEWEKSIE